MNIASESVVGCNSPHWQSEQKLHIKYPTAEGERQKEKDMKRNSSNATSNKEEKSYVAIPL